MRMVEGPYSLIQGERYVGNLSESHEIIDTYSDWFSCHDIIHCPRTFGRVRVDKEDRAPEKIIGKIYCVTFSRSFTKFSFGRSEKICDTAKKHSHFFLPIGFNQQHF